MALAGAGTTRQSGMIRRQRRARARIWTVLAVALPLPLALMLILVNAPGPLPERAPEWLDTEVAGCASPTALSCGTGPS